MKAKDFFVEHLDEYIKIRKYIHSYPEAGTGTVNTAAFVKEKLSEFGIKSEDIGENSVLGILDGTAPGKTIAFRADMDALVTKEENVFDYRSKNEGVMHACGHDGHTTMLLAAAQYLSQNNDFSGRVLFLFQSGEEGYDGALKIIQDGLFKKYDIDCIFGCHNWPKFETGKIIAHNGACMASEDRFYIKVKGKSGHASSPALANEPFAAVADIIKGCQSVVDRKVPAQERAVISITKVHGGSADNIIPDCVEITGNVRSCDPEIQDILEESVTRVVRGAGEMYGVETEITYLRKHPVLINSAFELGYNAAVMAVGQENVVTDADSVMGSEDFALYLAHTKGCFVWIGNGIESAVLHNSCYDFNDEIIPVGASFFVSLAKEVL